MTDLPDATIARRRRRAVLVSVTALALLGGGVAVTLTAGGSSRHHPRVAAAPGVTRAPATPTPARVAIGLTEANANLLWSPTAAAPVPAAFTPWRAALTALHPAYLRLVLDWAKLQPVAGAPASLDAPVDGCLRGIPPCGAYAGLRDELRAIASQQRAGGGFAVMIVIDGAPSWAAVPAHGCEPPGTTALSRPITPAGLFSYRALVAAILALGRQVGVALPYFSPWNEPNHPYFLSPQRARCSTRSPTLSPAVYAQLARAMAAQLAADGGVHQMILGELAGYTTSGPRDTSIGEFVASLPADVVCLGSLWSVHAYARRGAATLAAGPVGALEQALDRRGACGSRARVWVTETGAGAPHAGDPRPPGTADAAAGCRALAAQLARWYADPRVGAVFQYTFREDTLFPVGLADAQLTHLYPAYYLWRAWAQAGSRNAAPALPAQCA